MLSRGTAEAQGTQQAFWLFSIQVALRPWKAPGAPTDSAVFSAFVTKDFHFLRPVKEWERVSSASPFFIAKDQHICLLHFKDL